MRKVFMILCLCILLASCQTGIIEMSTDGTKTVLTKKDLEMYSISGSYVEHSTTMLLLNIILEFAILSDSELKQIKSKHINGLIFLHQKEMPRH